MNAFALELRYAFFISAGTFIWLMMEYLLGFHDEYVRVYGMVSKVALIIPIAFTFVALRKKREEYYDGVITFGQAFKSGLIIALLCAVFIIPIQIMFHYAINPRFFDVMIEEHIERAIRNGENLTEARNQAFAVYKVSAYVVQRATATLLTGLVLAVIFAWGTRRTQEELDALREKYKAAMDNRSES